jgi:hypothetical protein
MHSTLLVSTLVWLATAPASMALATATEPVNPTCDITGVMALVDKIPGVCVAFREHGEEAARPLRALGVGGAVYADETIKCDMAGDLQLTFCATRAQNHVALKQGQEYRVPVVTKNPEEHKSNVEEAARVAELRIPTCDKKLGKLAVGTGGTAWWTGYSLNSPDSLIRLFAAKSNCFDVVEGKPGSAAELALANSGEIKGIGTSKSADYLMLADIERSGEGKNGVNGTLGGLFGSRVGGLSGGVNKKDSAHVVLTLSDVRTTEQLALESGTASKKTLGNASNDRHFFGEIAAAGAGGYANTEVGRVVALAYLDSFSKLVANAKTELGARYTVGEPRSVTVVSGGQLHMEPDINAKAIRDVSVGSILHATGETRGIWWKVSDDSGNQGWILSTLLMR